MHQAPIGDIGSFLDLNLRYCKVNTVKHDIFIEIKFHVLCIYKYESVQDCNHNIHANIQISGQYVLY